MNRKGCPVIISSFIQTLKARKEEKSGQNTFMDSGQKFGQSKLQFAVGRDCIQKHFSKYVIE